MAIAAVLSLSFLYLVCRKCTCNLLLKLLGQLLLIIAILLSMFIVQPACILMSSFTMIWLTLLVLAIAIFVLYNLWYLQSCCPLTICDFWQAVIRAMTIAFLAAIILYTILAGGVLPLGLLLTVAFTYAISSIASAQIVINQNASNC